MAPSISSTMARSAAVAGVGCTANAAAATITSMARRIETVRKRVISYLFDHLVGELLERLRNVEAQRFRCFHVEHQIELSWLHNWQVGRLFAFENPADVNCGTAIGIGQTRSIAHQPAGDSVFPQTVDGRNAISHCQRHPPISLAFSRS